MTDDIARKLKAAAARLFTQHGYTASHSSEYRKLVAPLAALSRRPTSLPLISTSRGAWVF